MSKKDLNQEFLSSLGLDNSDLLGGQGGCALSGEESKLYSPTSEYEIDAVEDKRLVDLDKLRGNIIVDTKILKRLHKLAIVSEINVLIEPESA